MSTDTPPERFDYFKRIRRIHEAISYTPEHTARSQAELINALEEILNSSDSWMIQARLNRAEQELDQTITLLEEVKEQIQEVQDALPEREEDLP